MSEPSVRTCISCVHFKGVEPTYPVPMQQHPLCQHPKAASRDPIYGKALCQNERNNKKGCGPQGKLWELPPNAKKD